jgi:DUF1680 family protein
MQEAGYFDPAKRDWKPGLKPIPYVFWESDISKWLEAASYSLATQPDPELEKLVEQAIAFMVSLQQPDGYLNLWFTEVEPDKRWTNLRDWHELYCAGHLIEAAVAHFKATGKRSLLDPVLRYADYIDSVFGPGEGQKRGYCGHEEIELALLKLYRLTGQTRYLHLSQYFIEERGRQPHYFDGEALVRGENPANFRHKTYQYNQSHLPVREQTEVVGHAVRAMYLWSAVTELANELQDPGLFEACQRVWQHLTLKRMYLTGGIGPSADNEGFTADYDLPNATAYAETCASIGLVFWAHRMLQLELDSRYADVLEQALYNGVLSGISLDGTSYFYENPLQSQGQHHRQPWFNCACCPPNLARLFMSLGEYIYGVNASEIVVHLYLTNTANLEVGTTRLTLRQETGYPWSGQVRFELGLETSAEFGLKLRLPEWSKTTQIRVNGEPVAWSVEKGYALLKRDWQPGDKIELDLEMSVERVYAHPAVREDAGSVALRRGPLVYCLEEVDLGLPLHQFSLPHDAALESRFGPELLGGVMVIEGSGLVLETGDWSQTLYRTTSPLEKPYPFRAIPYYAWDQRQNGEMRVWLRAK